MLVIPQTVPLGHDEAHVPVVVPTLTPKSKPTVTPLVGKHDGTPMLDVTNKLAGLLW